MTFEEIITLTQAGFTKSDILAMTGQSAPTKQEPTQQAPAPKEPETPKQEPVQAPTQQEPAQKQVSMSQEQFNTLLQQLNVGKASIDVPPHYNLDDQLKNHFSELVYGQKPKED